MDIERIYFDMDGVLADFVRGVRELCGLDMSVGDDIMFEGIRKVDRFYYKLEPMPGMPELFDDLRRRYPGKVEILSAVPKPSRNVPTAGDDKREWVRKYLGEDVKVNIVLRREKPGYVKCKGSILVDDTEGNILSWNEAGGTGILFADAASAERELSRIFNQ